MRRHLALGVVLVSSLALAACGSEESSDSGTVAQAVAGQLAYLEPESALVVAVDLRYEEENWERLRAVGDRLIDEAREVAEPGELGPLPRDSEAALKQYVGLSGADFEEDVRPRLDGHLVIGLAPEPGAEAGDGVPATHVTTVYRTEEGGLREVLGRFMDGAALRPAPGHDDVVVTEDGVAVVGDDTLIAADTRERALAAVERAEAGQGLSPELVAAAERATGLDDPLVLATGTPDLARDFPLAEELERARAEVPYLAAVERIDMALDVREDAVEATAAVATTAGQLEEGDLPLGPAGEVEVPVPENAIAGGSLDQSRITTFAAKVMRSAFADSDFVAAVEETERELGIRFEEEVLRQFDCPSVSLLEPGEGALLGTGGRFSARSCVRDPERMRELLPELAPRLPRILTAMRGLGGGGLLGLLLVAPDAPLTPGPVLLQIDVAAVPEAAPEEQLYEVSGLRESASGQEVFPGPDQVVFGMIGDDFVVGSDRQAARDAVTLETAPAGGEAASALRVPPALLGVALGSPEAGEVLDRAFGDLEVGFSADARATEAHARMPLAD